MRNRLLLMGKKGLVPGAVAIYDMTSLSPDGQTLYDISGNGYHGTLGGARQCAAAPITTQYGLAFVNDYVDISGVLAALSGSTAFTMQIVTCAATSVPFAGIVADGAGTAATRTITVLDSNNGSSNQNLIYIQVFDGEGGSAVNAVTGRLTSTPTLITTRFVGGSVLESRRNAGAWVRDTTSVPARVGLSPKNGSAVLTVGKYGSYKQIGTTMFIAIYPFALSDTQLAQNEARITEYLAKRGISYSAPLPAIAAPIAIGDSITEGIYITGVAATQTYPYVLQHTYGYPVQNEGIGGNTTAKMAARLPALLSGHLPPVVLILGGTNDVSTEVAAVDIEANLTTMLTAVAGAGAKAVLLTIPPSSLYTAPRNAILADVNAWIATQAGANVAVADIHAALKDPETPTQLLAAYDSGDHQHPNADGLQVIANTVYATMQGVGWQ